MPRRNAVRNSYLYSAFNDKDNDVTRSMETSTHADLDIDFEKLKQATLPII